MTALELEIERLTLALAVVERSAAKARGRQNPGAFGKRAKKQV